MYNLIRYSHMIADEVRMDAHLKALEATVKPGMTVVDLGAGSGIFTLMACKLGASKVYAIDISNAVQVGRQLTRLNGFENQVEWIQQDSKTLDLPEQVDLMITDLRGRMPFLGDNLAVLADARDRFLKPDGILLPNQDQLWIAPAEAPDDHRKAVCPWGGNDFGFDLSPLEYRHAQWWQNGRAEEGQLLSEPVKWTTLDYKTISHSDIDEEVTATVERDAMAHGFFLWFDAEIYPGIGFSGGPGPKPPTVYGSAFFPWKEPVAVKKGDRIRIHLEARLLNGSYLWRWRTKIFSTGEDSQPRFTFDQSTFLADPPSLDQLRKRGHPHVPVLSEQGEIQARSFQLMDGERSLETIANELMTEFPDRFSTYEESLAFIGNLSEKFSC